MNPDLSTLKGYENLFEITRFQVIVGHRNKKHFTPNSSKTVFLTCKVHPILAEFDQNGTVQSPPHENHFNVCWQHREK